MPPSAIMDLRDIPLEQIVTSKSQARTRDLNKDLDALALSMSKLGLLEPITVFKNDEGKFEILAGQRRFSAAKLLKWREIPAVVRPEPADEYVAKAISLTENVTSAPMNTSDIMDACEMLFKRYLSAKKVAETVGISERIVKKYVKFARLPQSLKDAYDKGELGDNANTAINVALKAVDALNYEANGKVDEKKVLEFAKVLANKTGTQRRDLEEEAKKDPSRAITEIEKKASTPKKTKKLELIIPPEDYSRLETYSEKQKTGSAEEAALDLIVEGLERAGV
jgi:ParB family chromosome partitioning protein